MANTALPGFEPYRVLGGGSIAYTRARVLTNNTTAIFQNDAVVVASGGDYVVQSTGTTFTSNVSRGAVYTDATGVRVERKFLPAATLYTSSGVAPDNASYIYIVDDPLRVQFRASVDAAIALTDLNLNFAVTLGTGSTVTGLSGHKLTATGKNTTATIPWRVREFVIGDPKSDPDLADCAVICQINADAATPALSASTGI